MNVKYRTDFVTNSSSSNYITVNIYGRGINLGFNHDSDCAGYHMFYLKDVRNKLSKATSTDEVADILSKAVGPGYNESFVGNDDFDSFIQSVREVGDVSKLGVLHASCSNDGSGDGYENCDETDLKYDFKERKGTFSEATKMDGEVTYSGDPFLNDDGEECDPFGWE